MEVFGRMVVLGNWSGFEEEGSGCQPGALHGSFSLHGFTAEL